MIFKNREQAAEKLAERLARKITERPLILAIPRGSVAMAALLARRLGGDLDVILVHKIGAPENPEFAIGAVNESGRIFPSPAIAQYGIPRSYVEQTALDELERLRARRREYSGVRPPVSATGRIVVIVDDGLATGFTMLAAVRSVREQNPKSLIVAAPVASTSAAELLNPECDETVYIEVPPDLMSISQYYEEFPQVSDQEVHDILNGENTFARKAPGLLRHRDPVDTRSISTEIRFNADEVSLKGLLHIPPESRGTVLFAQGNASSRLSPRNIQMAQRFYDNGIGTLLFDSLTKDEADNRANVFNIGLLARRLKAATEWLRGQTLPENPFQTPEEGMHVAFFGTGTGAAAALSATADLGDLVSAVVCRGGRPDLVMDRLSEVKAPTLLLVGSLDPEVLELNRHALMHLRKGQLTVIEGASHRFEEPGTLDSVAEYALTWFKRHFGAHRRTPYAHLQKSEKKTA